MFRDMRDGLLSPLRSFHVDGIYDRRWMTSKLVPLGDTLYDVQWHSVPHGAVVLPRVAID